MTTKPVIQRALLSTSNKTGLVSFAKQLNKLGIEIIASGGTAKLLLEASVPVTEVSDYTGFLEIMDGRVKTLHPKIHGGILARRGIDDAVMQEQHIKPIDLLAVNLYPFQQTIEKPNCQFDDAIENIDIGGPTLLRAAAKNHRDVTVVVDPDDYARILEEIEATGNTSEKTRRQLAEKTFLHTTNYDATIANYLMTENTKQDTSFPEVYPLNLIKKADLRYGENPHQKAALYTLSSIPTADSLATAQQRQGKPLSFNNLMDSETALACVRAFPEETPTCVIVKHATPCGVACGNTLLEAYEHALATDSTSAFGGIIALNQTLDKTTAEKITSQQFVEVLLAPDIDKEAIEVVKRKTNLRILIGGTEKKKTQGYTFHSISGGLLIQESDAHSVDKDKLQVVTQRQPTEFELKDLLFAWEVVRFVKSNAIVYAKQQATLGIGTGQTSRVFSAQIAALKAQDAGLYLQGAVMASDAFFPFADGIEVAAKAGISAIIQPGGSKRDNEVIAAADKAGIAMLFTGIRHFRH